MCGFAQRPPRWKQPHGGNAEETAHGGPLENQFKGALWLRLFNFHTFQCINYKLLRYNFVSPNSSILKN
jgi:hypothetical protein